VTLVVTDLAVLEPSAQGLILKERAPGVSVEAVRAATAAPLIILGDVPEMALTP
jgi:acyl CoA:acetate/3-ketoacid CoA transferase beta subunit